MKWKPPRDYDKDKMLYPDRCMLKWQGFLLSDHNDRKQEEDQRLDMEELDDFLLQCWLHQTHLRLILREGELEGVLQLIRAPWLYLKTETETLRIHRNHLLRWQILEEL